MNRGSFSSSCSSFDAPHRGRSCQMDSPVSNLRDVRASRVSVMPSAVFPYLRRLDTGNNPFALLKDPLLICTLSSPSFLDNQVVDGVSRDPIYTIRTNGNCTSVTRSDPWNGNTRTADIEWPAPNPSKGKGKELEGVTLQMRSGRRKPADTFLRPASILSAPRKFKIPGYSRSLKWKAVGSSYWCIAASAKGPIAILEPAAETAPPRLKVFETLHDKYDVRPMMVHRGVSILLLDYLLVSSLLMVTDTHEWMARERESISSLAPDMPGSDDFGPRSAPPASTSALQWRKIIYGEPLYPKRQSSASTASHRFPTHASRMAKILNGDPIYPTLRRRSSSTDFSSDSDSESDQHTTDGEDAVPADMRVRPSPTPPRAPSPSAESVLYPLTTASAPSHTYLDPLFYNEYGVPPVPPLPAEYASSNSLASPGPLSASGSRRRELPRPPSQQSLSRRSRSSPPRPIPHTAPSSPIGNNSGAAWSPDRRRPSTDTILTRNESLRILPRPPPLTSTEASSSHPPLRHSQSSIRPLNNRVREKRSSQYAQRTLPPTPIAVSNPEWITGLRIRKRSHNDLNQWFNSTHDPLSGPDDNRRQSIFEALDCPPPAYNSIEYAAGTSLSISPSSPPPPPLPPLVPPPQDC